MNNAYGQARDYGDPNGQPAGFVGFGLNNLLNNKLTVLELSHIGPEQPPGSVNFAGQPLTGDPLRLQERPIRYYNDIVFTYKFNDDLTGVLEGNYTHDDFGLRPGERRRGRLSTVASPTWATRSTRSTR